MTLTKEIDGEEWICPRPQYCFSILLRDLHSGGYSSAPRVLLNWQEAELRWDEKGRCWLRGFPRSEFLAEKIVVEPTWFFSKLEGREESFDRVRAHLRTLIDPIMTDELSTEEMISELQKWKFFNRTALPYLLLVNFTVDHLVSRFEELLISVVSGELSQRYFFSLLESPYAEEILSLGRAPSDSKRFAFPPEEPIFVEAAINYSVDSDMDGLIFSRFLQAPLDDRIELTHRLTTYRVLVPIMVQLSDENFYLWKAYIVAVNHILDKLSLMLLREGRIGKQEEVLQLTLNEIAEACGVTEQRE